MVFQPIAAAHDTPCDVVFFAAPHEVAMREAPELLRQGKVVIDLSPAFRLNDAAVFSRWYGNHTAAELLPQAVYGLPETEKAALTTANLIACPGCYATAAQLAAIPLVASGGAKNILIDAKSGVSGAGKRSDRNDLSLAEMENNLKAYALDGHRHHPEILQELRRLAPLDDDDIIFVPHLLPVARGIHANLYATVDAPEDVATLLAAYWKGCPYIEVLPAGETAELAQVVHSNRAILSAHPLPRQRVLVSVVLDNLLKGAAGQAVQNMNIRFGMDETAGLLGAITIH